MNPNAQLVQEVFERCTEVARCCGYKEASLNYARVQFFAKIAKGFLVVVAIDPDDGEVCAVTIDEQRDMEPIPLPSGL